MALPLGFKQVGPFGFRKAENRVEILIYSIIGASFWGDGISARQFDNLLKEAGANTALKVRINSPGGSVYDGIAIYHALRDHKGDVEVVIEGLAASMASIIMLAGDKVIAKLGSQIMIHEPWTILAGDAEQLRKEADVLESIAGDMATIYAQRTGQDKKKVRKWMAEETWFTAEKALADGLVDAVDDGEEEEEVVSEGMQAAGTRKLAAAVACSQRVRGWNMGAFAVHSPFEAHAQAQKVEFKDYDPTAAFRLLGRQVLAAASSHHQQEKGHMTEEERKAAEQKAAQERAAQEAANKAIADAAAKAALEADANRRSAIRQAFAPWGDTHKKVLEGCLDNVNCTVEQAREKLLDAVAKSATPSGGGGVVEPGATDRQKFQEGATKALALRAGLLAKDEKPDRSNEFNSFSLRELARHSLRLSNINALGDVMAMVGMAFASTSDFPAILENVMNKAMLMGYGEAQETFPRWTNKGNLNDFKPATRVGLSEFSSLEKISEGGEYKFGKLLDRKVAIYLDTYGKAFSLTRQSIINDDLQAFSEIPRKMGRASLRTVGDVVYALFLSNPSYTPDGVAIFHANHANINAGVGFTAAIMDAGRVKMALQKDQQGLQQLNIAPAIWLGPHALAGQAKEVFQSPSNPDQANSTRANRVRDMVRDIVPEARLDTNSAVKSYLVADPSQFDTLEVAYLNGQETPFMERTENWNIDGVAMKVRLDFGVAFREYRTFVQNTGAA